MNNNSFTFLTQGSREDLTFNEELMSSLLVDRDLSDEDADAVRSMVDSLVTVGTFPFEWTPQEDAYITMNDRSSWLDYLIYRYKLRVYPSIKRVASFPVYVLIEPASPCNLRCTMCFQVDSSFTRKPYMGLMDMDLYRHVVDEIVGGGTRAVTLASRGEPTLHPKLGEMLSYASDGKFIDLKLNTNATKLSDDLCRDILRSDVNELVFSIDSHDKNVYESIRVRGRFDEVLENVVRFHRIRDSEFPDSRLQTRVSGVRFRDDQDPDAFVDFWSQIVDHVGYVDIESRWDTYNNEPHPSKVHPCDYLWERMYVWWDGTCNPCDVDYKSQLRVGNVKESSIVDIWQSPMYTRLREEHLAGDRSSFNPCDRCGV